MSTHINSCKIANGVHVRRRFKSRIVREDPFAFDRSAGIGLQACESESEIKDRRSRSSWDGFAKETIPSIFGTPKENSFLLYKVVPVYTPSQAILWNTAVLSLNLAILVCAVILFLNWECLFYGRFDWFNFVCVAMVPVKWLFLKLLLASVVASAIGYIRSEKKVICEYIIMTSGMKFFIRFYVILSWQINN